MKHAVESRFETSAAAAWFTAFQPRCDHASLLLQSSIRIRFLAQRSLRAAVRFVLRSTQMFKPQIDITPFRRNLVWNFMNRWVKVVLAVMIVQLETSAAVRQVPEKPSDTESSSESAEETSSSNDKAEAQKERLNWNQRTLVGAYEKIGRRNPKWDGFAIKALDAFAHQRGNNHPGLSAVVATNCAQAVTAGCDDPMIAYLHVRYSFTGQTNAQDYAEILRKIAESLESGQYPPIRKFYGWLRAGLQLKTATRTNIPARYYDFERLARTNLAAAMQEKQMPLREIDEACHEMFQALEGDQKEYKLARAVIDQAFELNWPNSPLRWLLRGEAEITEGWAARGTDYADKVSDEGFRLLGQHLALAAQALERAWTLQTNDVRIPIYMMKVELGQGKGRGRMEEWFERAMSIDTNNYWACQTKLYYLEPKWYGSERAMLEFGWECVKSKKWGGSVPLILPEAHDRLARYVPPARKAEYYKNTAVWEDIKAAYEKFFELNPKKAVGYRSNYARYAFWCKQWDEFNKLLPILGRTNYTFFGGKGEFNRIAALGREHSTTPSGEKSN